MGPSVSVLVGDYWLVKAVELILRDAASDTRAIRIFSKTLSDLAEGEMLQLQKAQKGDTDEDDYLKIIKKSKDGLFWYQKMGALLVISVAFALYEYFFNKEVLVMLLEFFGMDIGGASRLNRN